VDSRGTGLSNESGVALADLARPAVRTCVLWTWGGDLGPNPAWLGPSTGSRRRMGPWGGNRGVRAAHQIVLVQARHFVAPGEFGSMQKGHALTSAGGGSLMNIRLICQTTNAMITKAITALRKAP
jgi:hypothetical protein